ncbi:cupin domain-containing protein [Ferrimonas aestuarii]|uniref:Anti-sigma factor n=1 Tax=Ferrimonas aestuarii TaxID=2569539 RepID=A0A4U1BKC0_9GAMM|nr:cupin domain-containing protein [Ferrimonas aestuarii]TKB52753.1 anti-sigma factor [Ferrimonas aestuarii]
MEPPPPIKPMIVNSQLMDWQPSPSPMVWRKRLYHEGEAESGVVTSIVRYDPGSQFRSHPHPQGEEILVLEGVFSDEHGDYPAGSYLLNPEGVSHAPYSKTGCVLFVKLRQYAGEKRRHILLNTNEQEWQTTNVKNKKIKPLYQQIGFNDTTQLERLLAQYSQRRHYPNGAEILVLKGSFLDDHQRYQQGDWLSLPPGFAHQVHCDEDCELYLKQDRRKESAA